MTPFETDFLPFQKIGDNKIKTPMNSMYTGIRLETKGIQMTKVD